MTHCWSALKQPHRCVLRVIHHLSPAPQQQLCLLLKKATLKMKQFEKEFKKRQEKLVQEYQKYFEEHPEDLKDE